MKIPAVHYYIGVAGLFLIVAYFTLGTKYFNYTPLLYLLLGFGGSIVRYSTSIADLNIHLSIHHQTIFNRYAIQWKYVTGIKQIYPTGVFSPEVKQTSDIQLQQIVHRVKMNLVFLIVSFISFPVLTGIIMSWRSWN
ncbi:MAG: hypothetical protein AB8B56_18905 [Crocinitomicaceae bacterium]